MKKMTLLLITILALGISLWFAGQSNWHLNRNINNKLPTGDLKHLEDNRFTDEAGLIWELLAQSKNIFHQPEEGEEVKIVDKPYPNVGKTLAFDIKTPNYKFLSALDNGASYEAILQPDGTYLMNGSKQGTYNYGHPSGFFGTIKHAFYDVLPHFINSNYE